MDEQGPEGPKEEGQGRSGDVHVHGGLPPLSSSLLFRSFLVVQQPLIPFDSICSLVLLVIS